MWGSNVSLICIKENVDENRFETQQTIKVIRENPKILFLVGSKNLCLK